MKKTFLNLVVALFVVTLAACGGSSSSTTSSGDGGGDGGGGGAMTFEKDILPLFTEANAFWDGSQACSGCHFATSEASAHQLDMSSYAGILKGADAVESPPGVSILREPGSTPDWNTSKLKGRLRNAKMPPDRPFKMDESNRKGGCIDTLQKWVEDGATEAGYTTVDASGMSPMMCFTTANAFYEGGQACNGCHFAVSESSAHNLDLNDYAGTILGADTLEGDGVSILGASAAGGTDVNWDGSKLKGRLRNEKMPPGTKFDRSEANRDTATINKIGSWASAGAPETDSFNCMEGKDCVNGGSSGMDM